jgi:hypothetical protein
MSVSWTMTCDVCHQTVDSTGPWCDLYISETGAPCFLRCLERYDNRIAAGDQEYATVIANYVAARWHYDVLTDGPF